MYSTAKHHETIVSALQEAYLGNPLARFVSGGKLAELANGYISRTGFWDRLVWGPLRNNTLQGIAGDKLRAMIVVGGQSAVSLRIARPEVLKVQKPHTRSSSASAISSSPCQHHASPSTPSQRVL